MPVSGRAVGWLTSVLLALGGTAVALLGEHFRSSDARVLVVCGVLLSSVAGGWAARVMHRGAPEPGTWPAAVPCMVIGAFLGFVTFLLLRTIAFVVLAVFFLNSNFVW